MLKFRALVIGLILVSCSTPKITTTTKPVARSVASPLRPATAGNVTLAWNSNPAIEGIFSYHVWEVIPGSRTSPVHWEVIATVTAPNYSRSGMQSGTLHVFAVTALNNLGESSKSIPAITRIP